MEFLRCVLNNWFNVALYTDVCIALHTQCFPSVCEQTSHETRGGIRTPRSQVQPLTVSVLISSHLPSSCPLVHEALVHCFPPPPVCSPPSSPHPNLCTPVCSFLFLQFFSTLFLAFLHVIFLQVERSEILRKSSCYPSLKYVQSMPIFSL